MRPFTRLSILALAVLLSACSTNPQRQYESCIAGISTLGGGFGVAASGGSGAVPGAAVGAVAAALLCKPPAVDARSAAPVVASADEVDSDSDGDGVSDGDDACPGTPAGVAVDARGCARDSDADGVPDYLDRCARTPANVSVDENGCPLSREVVFSVDRLQFAFDSAALNADARSALDAALDTIRGNPSLRLDVIGHTDSSGPEAYNQRLSERRAQAAVDYLVSKGVDRDQLRAVGVGEAEPVASNDTRDGRERNRRVEIVVR